MEMRESTFLFADLAGFTALTEAHGDHDAATTAAAFHDMAEGVMCGSAQLVKTIGDAVMIAAATPADALSTAAELWARIDAEPNFPAAGGGLHNGTAVCRDGDYFGSAVNLTARIAAYARAGQVLCTREVADRARKSALATVVPLGNVVLKNIAQPVELFDLELAGRQLTQTEIDPVCRMQLAPETSAGRLTLGERTYYFCSLECAGAFAEAPASFVSDRE